MKLFGTVTSPYVRRVRIVAAELGEPVEMIDTTTESGQAELRDTSPIWKVPTAVLDDEVVLDSRSIIDALIVKHGHGGLRCTPVERRWVESNLHHVIDGALDSTINGFYLHNRDGVAYDKSSYLTKQRDRTRSAMTWLDGRVGSGQLDGQAGLGVTEIALVTTVAWMQFRATYPVADHANLIELLAAHAERDSLVATQHG